MTPNVKKALDLFEEMKTLLTPGHMLNDPKQSPDESRYARGLVIPLVEAPIMSDKHHEAVTKAADVLNNKSPGEIAIFFSDLMIAMGHDPTKLIMTMGAFAAVLKND